MRILFTQKELFSGLIIEENKPTKSTRTPLGLAKRLNSNSLKVKIKFIFQIINLILILKLIFFRCLFYRISNKRIQTRRVMEIEEIAYRLCRDTKNPDNTTAAANELN
jgi:hypothetical protein